MDRYQSPLVQCTGTSVIGSLCTSYSVPVPPYHALSIDQVLTFGSVTREFSSILIPTLKSTQSALVYVHFSLFCVLAYCTTILVDAIYTQTDKPFVVPALQSVTMSFLPYFYYTIPIFHISQAQGEEWDVTLITPHTYASELRWRLGVAGSRGQEPSIGLGCAIQATTIGQIS